MAIVRLAIQAHSKGFDKAAQDVNRAVSKAEDALTAHANQALQGLERQADGALIAVRGVTAKINQEGKLEDLERSFQEATRTFQDFATHSKGGTENLKIMRQTIKGITFEFDAATQASLQAGRAMTTAGKRAVDQARDQLEIEERIVRARKRARDEAQWARAVISQPGGILASEAGVSAAQADPDVSRAVRLRDAAFFRARDAASAFEDATTRWRRGERIADKPDHLDKENFRLRELEGNLSKARAAQDRLNTAQRAGQETAATRTKIRSLEKLGSTTDQLVERQRQLNRAVGAFEADAKDGMLSARSLGRSMEFLNAETEKTTRKLTSNAVARERLRALGAAKGVAGEAQLEKLEKEQRELEGLLRTLKRVTDEGFPKAEAAAREFGDDASKSLIQLRKELDKVDRTLTTTGGGAATLKNDIARLRREEIEKADDAVRKLETQLESLAITMGKKDAAALDKLRRSMDRAGKEFDDLGLKAEKAQDKLRLALEKGIEEPAREAEKELKDIERQLDRVTKAGTRTAREMRQLALGTIRSGTDVADIDDARFVREGGSGATSRGRAREGTVDLTDFEAKEGLFSKFDRFGSKMLIKIGLIYSALGAAQAVFRGFGMAIDAVVKEERFSDTMDTFINLSENASTGLESLGRVFNTLGGTVASFDVTAAAAKARMSGLAENTIPQVAQAARILSRAVGVDTTEAFDRLSRGIAKQEVEILDELGIIVRLQDSLKRWADANNRTVASMTAQERQVAFANEVLGVLAARYTQIGTQLNRTTDAAAQLKARWADLSITAGSSLGIWSDIGIVLGNAGAALTEFFLPTAGETRLRMELLNSQVRTFGGALSEVLGKQGTIKDVVEALEAFRTKLAALTAGSLEYEQTLEEQEKFLGKLKIAFPSLNREIAAYRGEVEGAAEKMGDLLADQEKWLNLISGKSLNDQAEGLAGMSLMADSVASAISRARKELQELKDADFVDYRKIRDAQADIDSLVEKEAALRKQSTSSAISFTGAGFTDAQAQPLNEILQIFGQLRAGVDLLGPGRVGSDTRAGISSRLANLSVSLDAAVDAGVFDPDVAANIKSRTVGITAGGRSAANRLLDDNFNDAVAEVVRNTPEAGRDIARLLFESAAVAGRDIARDRAGEFAHDYREFFRLIGVTDEMTRYELGLGFLNAPVIRRPGDPARRSDVPTPEQAIESRIGTLKKAQEDAATALKLLETTEAERLLRLQKTIEDRPLRGATPALRAEEKAKRALEFSTAREASERKILDHRQKQLGVAEAEIVAIAALIGGGTLTDTKLADTFKDIREQVELFREQVDTGLLGAKLKSSQAKTALDDRAFAILTKTISDESAAAGAVLKERSQDLTVGLAELARTTGDPLGAILETLRLQTEALTTGVGEIDALKVSVTQQLTEKGVVTGLTEAVDALVRPRLAELETLSDAIRATESRIPAQARRTTQSAAGIRGRGASAAARITDRESDFDRIFSLTGLGDVTGIPGLAAGRRRVEGMATSLEQVMLPGRRVLADMRAQSVLLNEEMAKLVTAGLGGSESFRMMSDESIELKRAIRDLGDAMESLQTRADSARTEGTDLLARSANHLAAVLQNNVARALRSAGRELDALTGTPEKFERIRAIMGGRPADVTATLGGREFSFGAPADIQRRRLALEAQIDALEKRRNQARDSLQTLTESGAARGPRSRARFGVRQLTEELVDRRAVLADLVSQEKDIRAAIEAGDFDKLETDIQKVVDSRNIPNISRQIGFLNDVLREMHSLTEEERGGFGQLIEDLERARGAAQNARAITDELKRLKAVTSARQGAIRAVGGAFGGPTGNILGGVATIAGGRAAFRSINATRRADTRANTTEFGQGLIGAGTATENLASIKTVSTMGKIAAGATLVGAGIEVATSAWGMFNAGAEKARQKLGEIHAAADAMGESISSAIADGFGSGAESMEDFLRQSLFKRVAGEIAENVFNASEFAIALDEVEAKQKDLNDNQKEFIDARRDASAEGLNVPQLLRQTQSVADAVALRDRTAGELSKAFEALRAVQADDQADSQELSTAQANVDRLRALKDFAEARRKVLVDSGEFNDSLLGAADTVGSLNDQIERASIATDRFGELLGVTAQQGKGVSEIATATFRAVTEPQANLLLSATVEMRDLQVQIEWNTRRTAEVLSNDILGALLANGFNAAEPNIEETAGGGNTPASWAQMRTSVDGTNAHMGQT